MKKEQVVVERTFNAPIEKVWRAITDNNELKNWYFQLKDFQAKVGFKFDFIGGPEDGTQYLHLCEVTEVVEGKKLTYSWRYDNYPGNSFVTWELFDKGEQTLLVLTHIGLETFEEIGPDFAKTSFNGGWTYFMHTALKNHLEPAES
ncbi:SRPBCC domain-containing protein [Pedobacter sp. Hv1]|uniref:SRPBCC family protein n=1 Tax=Pedobacter sp. Hv1 TaxID=1740090 RepID=UPI0006D8B022|nr:SRPBCC domain-containing protein [Pedobacter sp. Hv1]KQC01659.1 ATPase [Pedobacter sp. Hv1]